MPKKEIVVAIPLQKQRFLMNYGKMGLSGNAEGFEAKLDTIAMLRTMVPEADEKLTEEFGEEIKTKLKNAKHAVAEMITYRAEIKDKVLKREDVTSIRFIRYRASLKLLFKYLFILDQIIAFMVGFTDLTRYEVPAHYWDYLKGTEVKIPMEEMKEEDEV